MKNEFNQVVVWEGTIVGEDEKNKFEQFFKDEVGVTVKYITEVKTKPSLDENGFKISGTGDRNDVLFYIHNKDVGKFAMPKIQLGCRWWDDAISMANGGGELYSEEILEKYPTSW